MIHEIRTNNFHGDRYLRLRGPKEGFPLTPFQERRYLNELCPSRHNGCTCGGGYGTGPQDGSASVIADGRHDGALTLIPAED